MTRSTFIDALRGLAVILMIFFHFCYDLTLVGIFSIDFQKNLFFWALPRIIVTIFFSGVGISLWIGHHQQIKWNKFFKRQIKLFMFSIIISFVSYWLFPQRWIYFGTLHSIFTLSWMALPFVKNPLAALLSGFVFIILEIAKLSPPWIDLHHKSMDYIEPFPWVAPVLIGIYLGSVGIQNLSLNQNLSIRALSWLGRHSLAIYLIHQPLLFGLAKLLSFKMS